MTYGKEGVDFVEDERPLGSVLGAEGSHVGVDVAAQLVAEGADRAGLVEQQADHKIARVEPQLLHHVPRLLRVNVPKVSARHACDEPCAGKGE